MGTTSHTLYGLLQFFAIFGGSCRSDASISATEVWPLAYLQKTIKTYGIYHTIVIGYGTQNGRRAGGIMLKTYIKIFKNSYKIDAAMFLLAERSFVVNKPLCWL